MSRRLLESHCRQFSELKVVASCGRVADALVVTGSQLIDLIFLDIEMPDASGFELLEQQEHRPLVIVTSAKKEYAFEAFQYEVTDYLTKPITLPRFRKAIQKVLKLKKALNTEELSDHLCIRVDKKLIKLNFDDILFLENVGDYIRLQTPGSKYIFYGTLKKMEEKLPDDRFQKVHRSYIVNLEKIHKMEDNTLFINEEKIPVSRAQKRSLMKRLNMF